MKFALLLAAFIFSLVAIAHLLRLLFQVEVLIGGVSIPMWVSVLGFVVPGALAVALWREGSSRGS
jgi:hypothetical protein